MLFIHAWPFFSLPPPFLPSLREVGTIVRSLGCYPSEAELSDMLSEIEEEEPTGFIKLEKFQPMMARVLLEKKYGIKCRLLELFSLSHRYQPASEEQLVKAFATLDENHNSELAADTLRRFMTEDGEPFSQEEVEEMLKAATDPERDVILYRDFVTLMLPEQDHN